MKTLCKKLEDHEVMEVMMTVPNRKINSELRIGDWPVISLPPRPHMCDLHQSVEFEVEVGSGEDVREVVLDYMSALSLCEACVFFLGKVPESECIVRVEDEDGL